MRLGFVCTMEEERATTGRPYNGIGEQAVENRRNFE